MKKNDKAQTVAQDPAAQEAAAQDQEAVIAAKVAAGLSREQALEVVKRQAEADEAAARAELPAEDA